MKTAIIIITLFLSTNLLVKAQSKEDVLQMLELTETEKGHEHFEFTAKADNEWSLAITNMFVFYKKYVSSQDVGNCTFVPSCSVYALDAIKKQGVIVGMINFFDRFQRCHGLDHEQYHIHTQHHLYIDPVLNIKFDTIEHAEKDDYIY